jgi:HlyD family secretion protein
VKGKRGAWIAIIIAVAVALGWFGPWRSKTKAPKYREATVTRGPIESRVSATGTLNPVDQVEVGSQVSGILSKVNVDFNDKVKKGQVLAQIEPSLFRADLANAEAAIEKAKAQLADGERGLRRAKVMKEQGLIADADVETAQLTYDSRKADLSQAQASAQRARVNMQNTTIVAPIAGTVISRAVDAGQTVAASLQAPNLFTLAKDLTEMELQSRVDEADIGQVDEGMSISFTVDAFPDRTFEGTVRQIRAEPVTESGVVSYTVVSRVPNRDQKLLPGMTANVTIVSASRDDALRIPNAALRFRPKDARGGPGRGGFGGGGGAGTGSGGGPGGGGGRMGAVGRSGSDSTAGASGGGGRGGRGGGMGGRGGWGGRGDSTGAWRGRGDSAGAWRGRGMHGGAGRAGGSADSNDVGGHPTRTWRPATIYVLADSSGQKALKPVRVRVGITDGTVTELLPGTLTEGAMVVIGQEEDPNKKPATTTNPFTPQGGGGGGQRGGRGGGGR